MSNLKTDLESRIAAERSKLQAEEAREQSLTIARVDPLKSGDDAALDRIEGEIDQSRTAQLRITERIELLESSKEEAEEADHEATIDALFADAENHRATAEKLIRSKYPKLAKEMGALLAEVSGHESAIRRANEKLEWYSRDPVASSNSFRNRHGFNQVVSVLRSFGPRDWGHPAREFIHWTNGFTPIDTRSGQKVTNVESEVEEKQWVPGHVAPSLLEVITLPGLFESDEAFWPRPSSTDTQTDLEEDEAE